MTTSPATESTDRLVQSVYTARWALRRALMGLVILFVVIWCAAWLLHSSIDPRLDAEAARAFTVPSAVAEHAVDPRQ